RGNGLGNRLDTLARLEHLACHLRDGTAQFSRTERRLIERLTGSLSDQPLNLDQLVQPFDTGQDGQSLLLGYIAQRLQLVAEPPGLVDVLAQIDLPELIPQLPGPVVQAADDAKQVVGELSQPPSRLRVDDATGLQSADDGFDEPGQETRVRLGKGCARQTTNGRRDVARLEPGRTQELQHRGRTTAQHVPWNDRFATMDDAGDLIRGAPTGPWRAGLESRQAEDTPDVARPVDVKWMRLWRRIVLAEVFNEHRLHLGFQLGECPLADLGELPLELVPIPRHRYRRCSAIILFAALDELKGIDQRLKPSLVDLPSESVPRIVKLGRAIWDTRRRTALGDVNRIEDALQPLDAEHVLDSQPHRHVDGRGAFNVTGQ